MSDTSVLEHLDLEALLTEEIACSGKTHPSNAELHGDGSAPASHLIRYVCPDRLCDRQGWRPVCEYFATVTAKRTDMTARCGKCGTTGTLAELFTDVRAL